MAIAPNILADHCAASRIEARSRWTSIRRSSEDPAAQHLSVDTVRDWLEQPKPRERESLRKQANNRFPL